ncbi:ParB/RepB/Spo0J family partition protein [Desulfuromonas acetoxidans]|uniref:ParB-like partition proteins n=1 Tax=Desulfuromonas acetoxidans (strain DSM 684 / 11070) TaxID=281689 RepID=Q1JYN0_DESA6|nr:ParB/RepB/Spo0J family partition protein [Desulfuromonas acetoxidans]EAT15385.1 parB-like partition proteins [Desulfuromonas acetoxidans DSM 684]MBF0646205.1 ParB/RepB/Spo0J family partition protein [Desulfuromonas acetoxidans]NVD24416.1 ParB/RepB/Spo0J family partition protein [Desulfuromonas acetoxidans]NVE16636.1 ParB/RepB/Spo0J family partition protein [Desulfuromonas acetoxidans]
MNHTDYIEDQLYELELSLLSPDPNQPRKHFDDKALLELKETICQHGVLQPVLFTLSPDGQLQLISGERRYRASKLAGLTHIPAIFKKQASLEVALIENIVRENLSPIEEAEAIQRLIDDKICRQKDLPEKLGKAKSTISEILSLNRLPEEIKNDCRSNNLVPRGILVEVAKKRKKHTMLSLYEKYKARGLTRGEVRKVSRQPRRTTPGSSLQKSIDQLMRKIELTYELGFNDDDEKQRIESQLFELKKQIDARVKPRSKNDTQAPQQTLEFNF